MRRETMEDSLANHPGLVWREKVVEGVPIHTFSGPMPTQTVERKPDLNLAALSRCAKVERAQGGASGWGDHRERESFREALLDLVRGIDVRGEDGSWSIDREALDRAKAVLGIEEREDRLLPLRRRITEVAGLPSAVLGLEKEGTL